MKSLLAFVLIAGTASLPAAEAVFTLTSTKGEKVADATLALIPLDGSVPPVSPDARIEITQRDEEFHPYITVIQAGTRVVFPNDDKVQHHVYSLSKARKFELPLYNPGRAETLVFDIAGQVTLGCNIHDWMISHVVVVPTPWFGKSDAGGHAELSAPAGRYRLEIWHPRLGAAIQREITLSDAGVTTENDTLALRPERRVRRTPVTKSSGY